MIRGHIEVVTHEVIQGWIYSADGQIRDQRLLAFAGERCVGAGKVEIFRSDLAEAGIGDGYLGFSFGVTVEPEAVSSIVVRMDGSDAVLLQPNAVVLAPGDVYRPPVIDRSRVEAAEVERQLTILRWQLRHHRIGQSDFDFLRALWSLGVYERSLLHREVPGGPPVADLSITVATDLLEAYLGHEAEITIAKSVNALTFADTLQNVVNDPRLAPVVALCSYHRVGMRVLEGSHLNAAALPEPRQPRYIDYPLNTETLVMLDTRVSAELYAASGQSIAVVMANASPA